jgi:hypothetical protein
MIMANGIKGAMVTRNDTILKHMKATLEFNLPDEDAEFYCATKGTAMLNALWEINSELRTLWKYEELNDEEWKIVERIREKFFDILQDNDINLDK